MPGCAASLAWTRFAGADAKGEAREPRRIVMRHFQ
jgi:hypothetical protein